jgi:hypothetical protein
LSEPAKKNGEMVCMELLATGATWKCNRLSSMLAATRGIDDTTS